MGGWGAAAAALLLFPPLLSFHPPPPPPPPLDLGVSCLIALERRGDPASWLMWWLLLSLWPPNEGIAPSVFCCCKFSKRRLFAEEIDGKGNFEDFFMKCVKILRMTAMTLLFTGLRRGNGQFLYFTWACAVNWSQIQLCGLQTVCECQADTSEQKTIS